MSLQQRSQCFGVRGKCGPIYTLEGTQYLARGSGQLLRHRLVLRLKVLALAYQLA